MKRRLFILAAILAMVASLGPGVRLGAATTQQQSQNGQLPPGKGSGQDQHPLSLKAELVQVRAVVTDRKGQLIGGLTKDDFEVLENGVPQQIDFFSAEQIQSSPGSAPAGTPHPTTGAHPAANAGPGRTIVLFVDNLHLSISSLLSTKQQLRQFVDEQMSSQDVVAIVTTAGSLGILQQFTKDKKMLRYAINKINTRTVMESVFTPYLAAKVLSNAPGAVAAGLEVVISEDGYVPCNCQADPQYVESRAREVFEQENNRRRASLLTLKAVCDELAPLPGQRMVAVVSDGFTLLDDGGSEDHTDLQAVTGRAARSGVVIYSFGAQGLATPVEAQAATKLAGGSSTNFLHEASFDQNMVLRTVSAETGGEAFLNTNNMNKSLQTMLASNSIYYSLAYYPPDDKNPDKARKITVRVKNHPEYAVRAQKSYVPAEDKKEEAASTPQENLTKALGAPLPATAIAVTSSSDYLEREGDDSQVLVQVHIDGNTLQYQKEDQNYSFHCEMAGWVIDNAGKLSTSFADVVQGVLTPAQLAKAKASGYRYNKTLTVKPGLYQVRVGVREVGSELIGTSNSWVEVPDLSKGKPALSSIFLANDTTPALTASSIEPAAAKTQRSAVLAIGTPSFHRGDIASYRLVVYNVSNPTPDSTINVEILKDDKPIYGAVHPLAERKIRSDAKGMEVGGQLKVVMPAGFYTLRVSVKEAKSKKTAQQTVDFEVEQ